MILDVATTIAREAGALLRQAFPERRSIDYKSAAELVTDMDLASEQLLVNSLRQHFPSHLIVAEEGGADEGAQDAPLCWVIDPLDGTNNYAHGYPMFSVSLALLQHGQPVLGVVYDPLRDECFTAEYGSGAFCNGRQLRVSRIETLSAALLLTGFPYSRFSLPETNIPEVSRMLMRCQDIRRSGSAALDLCYVAAGRGDGYWELGLKPWDHAAGALIVAEAGGRVSDWSGGPWNVWRDRCAATNGLIHDEMLTVLNEY